MKRVMLALICCGLLAAPAFAQDDDLESKSTQELHEELHKLMKKASDEMEELEKELAKTSLESSKPDIVAERIKRVREMMEKGELDGMPEGLQEYLKENPDEAARLTGKSVEEFKKLAEDSAELEKLLRKNPELLKKLAGDDGAIDDVMKRQVAIEKRLEETLKRTEETAEKAKKDVNDSIEVAHIIKSRSCWQGSGVGNSAGQSSNDPREKEEKQGDKPGSGAQESYTPGSGENPPDNNKTGVERGEGEGWKTDKKHKDMGEGSSSADREEPGKYKGFWEKFNKRIQEKSAKDGE